MNIIARIKQNKLLKAGAFYSIASTMSGIAGMIVGFMNMRWLGPELLGIWQSLTIINSYLPFLQLGIQSSLNIDLPVLLGKGDQEQVSKHVGTAKSFAIVLSVFIAIVGSIVVAYLVIAHRDLKIIAGAMAIVYLAFISCLQLHLIATYRSASAFDKLSKIYIVDTVATLLLMFFIYKYLYYGLLLYHVVKETIKVVLMYIYAPYRKMPRCFDKNVFKGLFGRGVLLMALGQIKGVIDSFPRILLLSLGGVFQVGLFSPALAVHGLMDMIPKQITQFLQPQMGYKYGQTKKAVDLMGYVKKLTLYLPLMTIPFAVIGWLLIGPVVEFFFPKYIESIWAIKVMMLGFIFASSYMTRNLLMTLRAYKEIFILYGIDIVLFIAIPFLAIKLSPFSLLTSLAIGLSISYLFSYTINYFVVKRTIKLPKYNIEQS